MTLNNKSLRTLAAAAKRHAEQYGDKKIGPKEMESNSWMNQANRGITFLQPTDKSIPYSQPRTR